MDRVVETASNIASRYGSANLDLVARQLGVAVYDILEHGQDLKECYFPELKAIALRPGLPWHQRRFLIGHGLGHHVLHRGKAAPDFVTMRGASETTRDEREQAIVARTESEADLFSSYLLVPNAKLSPILRAESFNAKDALIDLAIEFQVPVEAIRVRLVFEKSRQLRDNA